jgi:hypothetical protein
MSQCVGAALGAVEGYDPLLIAYAYISDVELFINLTMLSNVAVVWPDITTCSSESWS